MTFLIILQLMITFNSLIYTLKHQLASQVTTIWKSVVIMSVEVILIDITQVHPSTSPAYEGEGSVWVFEKMQQALFCIAL